jgi:diguanylate cyclase (GGDEF)-like protein
MNRPVDRSSLDSHSPARVLVGVADDSYARLVRRTLKDAGYHVAVALDSETVMAALEPSRYDLVVLDSALAKVDGMSLCERIRLEPDAAGLYVISLIGEDETASIGSTVGPDDFVVKPFDAADLTTSVHIGARIVGLQLELAHANESLTTLALLDPLTALPNRQALYDLLQTEIARQHRVGPPTCIALFNVDRMRRINETYGAAAGDLAILRVARTLHAGARDADIVTRLDEDEFVVLLYDCLPQNSHVPCERLAAAVAHEPIMLADEELNLSVTCGVVQVEDDVSPLDVLEGARAALHSAKARRVPHVALATRDLGDDFL